MSKIAYVNYKFLNFTDAKIHVEDRGLQFGDSIYEVIPIFNKKLIDLNFHFNRLKYSLSELNIKYKLDKIKLKNIFIKLIDKNFILNGVIYLQITRGVQSREHAFKKNIKPTIIIYTQKKKFNLPNIKFKGVNVITYDDLRWSRRDIKTTNLLPNILAETLARKKNAYTAILIKNNKITEGTHCNIWIVKNNKIFTHPSNQDILKGVTRTALKTIIRKLNLIIYEKSFTKKQLYNADEVFLTSSGSFVTPILKIDSILINNGKIGNITLKIAKLYFNSL
tara:strand:+ start:114 stop:950 length:837 start_codon:yes stop_codon:yes gene_type:complete